MVTRAEFRHGFLARLSCYQLGAWRAFGGWEVAESGSGRCDGTPNPTGHEGGAKWNVYNTTMPWPNTTNFNDTGVKNYKTYADGIAATVKTMNEAPYKVIRDTIHKANVSAEEVMEAIATTPWGTSLEGLMNGLQAYLAKKAYYDGLQIGV